MLERTSLHASEKEQPDTVGTIIDALRSTIGDNAAAVAAEQLERADAESLAIWTQIVERLKGE